MIGLGVGHHHAREFSDIDDVDLYVCDLDPAKVERAQKELTVVGTFSTVEEVLASDVIGAVDIALPHHLHCPVVIQAVKAGKPLYDREADGDEPARGRCHARYRRQSWRAASRCRELSVHARQARRRAASSVLG